ncbi:enoyl-CoA hydratase/isomerase family protein [Arthrobacter sp. D1-29]
MNQQLPPNAQVTPEQEVLFEVRGHLGHITLNRPRAINALNHAMVKMVLAQLEAWSMDRRVSTVLVTGSGERGLCAGGDIVSLYRDAREGDGRASADFWRDEYRLNVEIANYPKPYVAVQDGLVLGGGIGISAHGSHRIVTERSKLGMPETGIGFIPDVGGTRLLSRAPGELGTYLALTAGSVGGADAIALGLSDSWVPSARIPELIAALENLAADDAVAAVVGQAPVAGLLAHRAWIDPAFSADSVAEIVERLRHSGTKEAREAATAVTSKSPTALAVTLESLRRARHLDSLEDTMQQEFRVSLRALRAHDFAEGVRAQVVDKDRLPNWDPAGLHDVTTELINAYFASLGDDELELRSSGLQTR